MPFPLFLLTTSDLPLKNQHILSVTSEDDDGSANGGPAYLFFLEDDLVEKVLKVLVCIVDA